MGIEDNDMIDRALDAVESRMEEAEVEVPEVETPVEEAPGTEESSKEDKVEEAQIKKALDKEKAPAKELKKKSAKSAAKISDQEADVEKIEEVQEVSEAQAPEAPPIDLPAFWSAEEKAVLAKAPREALEIIARKEAQRNEYVNRLANESERGKAIEARMSEVIKPYETKLKANGAKDAFEAVERILAWNDLLTADRKSVMLGLSDLMRKNGITPYDFLDEGNQETEPQADPRIEEAMNTAQEARRELQEWRESQAQQMLNSEIETFKSGKDSTGQVRKPFVEMYEPQIASVVSIIRKQNPGISKDQALNNAYEYVIGEARKAFGVNGNGVKPTSVPDVAKAKAASGSVSGAPASGAAAPRPRLKGNNFNEKIESALDNAFDAMGV